MLGESGVPGGVFGDIFASGTVESFVEIISCFLDDPFDVERAQCDSRTQVWPELAVAAAALGVPSSPHDNVFGVFGVDVAVTLVAGSELLPFSFSDCKAEKKKMR